MRILSRRGNYEREWIRTSEQLPPEEEVVETKIDDQNGCTNLQVLIRIGRLWFLPNRAMYVYYTPTHWRRIK